MAAGLGADLGVAAAAFVGTNVDNCVVAMAMVAGAPLRRAHRIAAGQAFGFVVLVAVSAAAAAVLFEFSTRRGRAARDWCRWPSGCTGWSAWRVGIGTVRRRRTRRRETDAPAAPLALKPEQRAVGRGLTAAALVTIAAGGDNLAVYIPLFRVGGATNVGAIVAVFVVGEALVTWLILAGGRHPKARGVMLRLGHVAVPVLLCCVGILVLVQAGTFSLL